MVSRARYRTFLAEHPAAQWIGALEAPQGHFHGAAQRRRRVRGVASPVSDWASWHPFRRSIPHAEP